ncbi:hypothetical protein RMN57_34570 [Kitasatospora sp. CM 4170]|uniref:Carrier domain-containing protein n=1 Tax=Kitasatospora aburaviensis TaxID=67265 RepID=A0ABW1F4G2_9ACTN|nr:hypothetical protein [Kitasatospora sp. CM 4170]WNM49457.1 hypothetical protein RMN57_34570 [Kitasatospora sp. CM 4170]
MADAEPPVSPAPVRPGPPHAGAAPGGSPHPGRVRPELVALLVEAAGAPPEWAERVTPTALLDADLMLDEHEIAALDALLCSRFGPSAGLARRRAGLDLPALEALTVADVQRLLPAEEADR